MVTMDPGIGYHIITVGSLLIFKTTVIIVGYKIAKLGYNLLLKGITGQFTFSANIKGAKADVVSASPGIFFILMATILICIAVVKDKPFSTKMSMGNQDIVSTAEQQSNSEPKKPVPPARE